MILSFKKMVIYSVVVILASATATWGLKTLTYSEVFGPVEVETRYGPVKLTMILDKTSYRLGELVNITLTIANISNETVLLGFSSPCKTNFVVCNQTSQTIFNYFTSRVWAESLFELVLDSGESFSQALTWNQLEIDNFPPFASRHVQPGTYYIKGQIGGIFYIEGQARSCLRYVGPPEEYDPLKCIERINIETQEIEIEIA